MKQSVTLNTDKIGNLLIYLIDRIAETYKQPAFVTKLLKLMYIIDETAVKETGSPVTGLDYRVWKMGPVAYEVYKDLMHDNSRLFSFYVEGKKRTSQQSGSDYVIVQSVNSFNDSEFSDYEIELMDKVVQDYGYLNSPALIDHLHGENSLWAKVVNENKLVFESQATSDFTIDLGEAVEDDFKKELFKNSQASLRL